MSRDGIVFVGVVEECALVVDDFYDGCELGGLLVVVLLLSVDVDVGLWRFRRTLPS